MRSVLPAVFVILATSPNGLALADGPEPERPAHVREFDKTIVPLLRAHCLQCHGPDDREGGINLAAIKDDTDVLRARSLWKRASALVASGKMPPPDDDDARPLADEPRRQLVHWLRTAATFVDCQEPSRRDPGPASLRRLSRVEYDNTVRDLLGINFDSAREVGMPTEEGGDGFDNRSASLGLSPALIDKYFAAADALTDAVFAADGRGANARKRLILARPGPDLPAAEAARQVIAHLARVAYRRPPDRLDIDRLFAFYERATARGASFDDAIRAVLKPILVSPRFLFRVEDDRPATAGSLAVPVDDHELAVRLSYFLWSTLPDAELFRLADAGRLSDPTEFPRQVKRLLADPKARALTENFAARWLRLSTLDQARPSTEFFPTFDNTLKRAMRDEVTTFFDHLRQDDRPIFDLLDADYTYVNAPLAAHYGLAGVTGSDFRKVAIAPDQHRGGLLGMAAVLTMTSHTFRTSPTLRGKYVLDVVFGTPPPPPPANAGQLKDDRPPATGKNAALPSTFRRQLARHAAETSCAACHRKIDPLGFAMDNYNAIGAWRESTPERPLDVQGMLPTGETLNGATDLKRVLLNRKDDFARNLVERLLVYALGRDLDYFDDCAVNEALATLHKGDDRFSSLILGVAESLPFRYRRAQTRPTPLN